MNLAPASADLGGLTLGNRSQFNQLVQLGDVRGALQLANAVLQTIEQSNITAINKEIAVGHIYAAYSKKT